MKTPHVRFASFFALSAVALGVACAPQSDGEPIDQSNAALSDKPYGGTCTPGDNVCAYFAPTDMPMHAILAAMKGAKTSIRIATYNINIPELATVLRERMDAGVKVELMEDFTHAVSDEPDQNSVWKRVGDHANLTKYMLPVFRGGTPQMHDKILIVDNQQVFFGSANWTFTGLVGNFENVMAIRDSAVVAKYAAELDELEAIGKLACETFGTPLSACGKGSEQYPIEYKRLAIDGAFQAAPQGPIDKTKPGCGVLVSDRDGLLIAGNQPRIDDQAQFKACFVDAALGDKYATFVNAVAGIEKYVDGTLVKDDPPVLTHIDSATGGFDAVQFKHHDTQTGAIRVYFSGEDDVEYRMYRELQALETTPGESFALLSTNFLTNSRLVKEVVKLKDLGVYTRVFFDRGRFYDPNFHSQFFQLTKLGFTRGLGANKLKVEQGADHTWTITNLPDHEDEASLEQNVVSVFDNDLSGNYGADHNKFAILGKRTADGTYRVVLMNGSANWSGMAMEQNDENLVVIEDQFAASLYLREMFSQMAVFRYAQNESSTGLAHDLDFVRTRVPCFDAVLGNPTNACMAPNGQPWNPNVSASLIMAVKNVPIGLDGSRRLWAWVPHWQVGEKPGRAFELFSASTFEGKWVTSIPFAPNGDLAYKFFTAPAGVDPNKDGLDDPGIQWEYGGMGNDRHATLGSRPLMTIRSSNLSWGNP